MVGEAGPRLIGRYEIDGLLGRGGMGAVYSAHDPAIGRPVAIKLVSEGFRDPRARERLANEARAAGRLQHPNIVTIFDVGEHDGQLFIVMERVLGEPMSSMLSRQPRLLDLPTGLALIEEACGALAYAHQMGIVHLDIKPDNLMVDQSGHVKVLDFGIAHVGGDDVTRTSSIVGSLRYMAPEQLTSGVVLDRRCDVFAVGCILYELVAGVPAFEGRIKDAVARVLGDDPRPLTEVAPATDPDLSALVARMMSRDPRGRPSALAEVGHELAVIRARLTGHPVANSPTAPFGVAQTTHDRAFAAPPPISDVVAHTAASSVPRLTTIVAALVLVVVVASIWIYARRTAEPAALPSAPASVQTDAAPLTETPAPAQPSAPQRPGVERPNGADTPQIETVPARGATPQQTRRAEANRDRIGTDTPPQLDSAVTNKQTAPAPATTQSSVRSQEQPSVPATPPEQRTTSEVTRDAPAAPQPPPAPASPAPPAVARANPGGAPPAAAPVSDETRVLAALDRYKRAFEERRPDALAEVYPSLTNEQRARLRRDLSAVDRYAIDFANTQVAVRGETATVTAVVTREMQPRVGGLQKNSTPTVFHFQKIGEDWVIDGIAAR